jgi:thioredoxin-like negative regulator of GroEL
MIAPSLSTDLPLLRQKAMQLVQTEQWDDAQTALEELLQQAPDDALACIELADLL